MSNVCSNKPNLSRPNKLQKRPRRKFFILFYLFYFFQFLFPCDYLVASKVILINSDPRIIYFLFPFDFDQKRRGQVTRSPAAKFFFFFFF